MTTSPQRPARPCRRCHEDAPAAGKEPSFRPCRCRLARLLQRRLDDGTGDIAPQLRPLHDLLLRSPKPETARGWLYKPHVAPLLAELATGQRKLTHEGLHTYPHRNVTSHLRALLISCGVLPDADKQLLDYERWLNEQLNAHSGHPGVTLLQQFGRWELLARMRAAAARGPLPPTAANNARRRFRAATNLLTWLVCPPTKEAGEVQSSTKDERLGLRRSWTSSGRRTAWGKMPSIQPVD